MRFHNVLQKIGNTSIIKLSKLKVKSSVEIWGKIESQNPGGSIKDRPALFMIEDAEKKGLLTKEKIVIEASSGNTGIGLSLVCAVKGYKCMIAMSESASIERRKIMQAFGAEILLTPAEKGTDGAIEAVYELLRNEPEKYFCPDQFNNEANWKSHYYTTGPEIWRDTEGKVTHVVCGLGTTGTAMGIARFAKDHNLPFKVIGVEPYPHHKIQGLKNMKESYPPGIYNKKLLEKVINIEDEEAFFWARWLAREEGIFVGISSGAALAGALKVAESLDQGLIVVIFPDGGERYLSTPLWTFEPKDQTIEAKADLIVFNTLSEKREVFTPLVPREVKIYTCGPTLNLRPHVGLYRRLITADILKEYLTLKGYKVKHVVNLTDFDDKTIKKALEEKKNLYEITKTIEEQFYQDVKFLNLKEADFYPKVSQHLKEMADVALKAIEKDKAYVKYGSVYFDISRLEDYGKLSKVDLSRLKPGATIDVEEYDKEEPFDFALLKRVHILELKAGYFVDTSVGKVRPTWHIHCAALILKYLGEEIDFFTSGIDLLFPHHENTRAVLKALTGKETVKYWLHTGMVFYQGKKLSSENRVTIEDVIQKGFSGRDLRFYFLRTHYRNPFNFSWKGLEESAKILRKIDQHLCLLEASVRPEKEASHPWELLESFTNNWERALKEDLNTPVVISELISFLKKLYPYLKQGVSPEFREKVLENLKKLNGVLKVLRFPKKVEEEEVLKLACLRDEAKRSGNFTEADRIRNELLAKGFWVFDLPWGTEVIALEE
ncbi:cysteine--tRNA ligase [Thermodesulfobacterium sp. TA1]|uniref:cysteine--tRNA ligase n=1 Tax=Thermodesulfobacterium sp. TA1 TaxID=2234087 RepID=UPI0012324B66|nr:cysteine--tRNA ligase [Thermodesulfobacterium sp. TA1]QER42778.1 cysteine--tRNA ligase [Thermodesulfobacterium sp. TA1]